MGERVACDCSAQNVYNVRLNIQEKGYIQYCITLLAAVETMVKLKLSIFKL